MNVLIRFMLQLTRFSNKNLTFWNRFDVWQQAANPIFLMIRTA